METNQEILSKFKEGYQMVFLTGGPGVGKTWKTKKLLGALGKMSKVGIVAPTGKAAINLGGQTINRFFGIGISTNLDAIVKTETYKNVRDNLNALEFLVIDEISMVSGEMFGLLDQLLKREKHCKKPFGGIPLLIVGDFYQLPPVSKVVSKNLHAFHSKAWKSLKMFTFNFREIKRQSNVSFAKKLNDVRKGITPFITESYFKRFANNKVPASALKLRYTNREVDAVNTYELAKLSGRKHTSAVKYRLTLEGRLYPEESAPKEIYRYIRSDLNVLSTFEYSNGARVMLLRNHSCGDYVNGSMGTIVYADSTNIHVDLDDGDVVDITKERFEFSVKKDNVEVILAEIFQFPMKLAYASTIHKSQGMSLTAVDIDIPRASTRASREDLNALVLVALSRVTDPRNLRVTNIRLTALTGNPSINHFYQQLEGSENYLDVN